MQMYNAMIDPVEFFKEALPEAYEVGGDAPGHFDAEIKAMEELTQAGGVKVEPHDDGIRVPLWACLEGFSITRKDLRLSVLEFDAFLRGFVAGNA
jgi:hypothetical protein